MCKVKKCAAVVLVIAMVMLSIFVLPAGNGKVYAQAPQLTACNATASSTVGGSSAGYAIDGDLNTYWQASDTAAFPKWLQLDMGRFVSVSEINIVFYSSSHAAKDFEIRISDKADGSEYKVLKTIHNNTQGEVSYTFNAQQGKFVRIVATSGNTDMWWNPTIKEVKVYGTEVLPPENSLLAAEMISATASSTIGGSSPNNAIDGNLNTYWQASDTSVFPKWLQINLGTVVSVSKVNIVFYSPSHAAKNFEIRISNNSDGSSYKVLQAVTNNASEVVSYTFEAQDGQYIRVVATSGTTDIWWNPTIKNIEVFKTVQIAPDNIISIVNASASSTHPSVSVQNAYDGNDETHWKPDEQSVGFPKWIQFDMGQRKMVNSVALSFLSQSHAPKNFELRISDNADGSNYKVLKGITNNKQAAIRYNFEAQSGRYIRVYVTAGRTDAWWNPAINGVWIYGPLPVTITGGTASSSAGSVSQAYDTSESTYWQPDTQSTTFPKWIQLDLGKTTPVGNVEFNFYSSNHAPKNFELRLSNNPDGTNYQVLKTVVNNNQAKTVCSFEPKYGRYIRVHVTEGNTNDWWNPTINDIKVYAATKETVTEFRPEDYGGSANGITDNMTAVANMLPDLKYTPGKKKIVFSEGTYKFNPSSYTAAILLAGVSDLEISGKGTDKTQIIMANPNAGFIEIIDGLNISVKYFSIDFSKLPFTQGTVVAVNNQNYTYDLQIDQGYGTPMEAWWHDEHPDSATRTDMFRTSHLMNAQTRNFKQNVTNSIGVDEDVVDLGNGVYRFKNLTTSAFAGLGRQAWDNGHIQVGDAVVVLLRLGAPHLLRYTSCENTVFDSINVYASNGFGLINLSTRGTAVARNINIVRKGNRLISLNADAVNFTACRAKPLVENVYIEANTDDSVSVGSNAPVIRQVNSSTQLFAQYCDYFELEKGDRLLVFNQVDGFIVGESIIYDVQLINHAQFGEGYLVTLESPINNITVNADIRKTDLLFTPDTMSSGLILRDSTVRFKAGRAVFVHSQDILIENCNFYKIAGETLSIVNEAPNRSNGPVRNVVIRNNTFTDTTYGWKNWDAWSTIHVGTLRQYSPEKGDIYVYNAAEGKVSENIQIYNNTFTNTSGNYVYLSSAKDAVVRDNIMTTDSNTFVHKNDALIIADNSQNVLIQNNVMTDKRAGLQGVIGLFGNTPRDGSGVTMVGNTIDTVTDSPLMIVGGTASALGDNAALAYDGNTSTFWQPDEPSTTFPKWLQLDLGERTLVSRVDLSFFSALHAPKNFELRISDNIDGSNYQVLKNVTDNSSTDATYSFTPKIGRYVRIHVTEGNSNSWWNPTINEVKVYGTPVYKNVGITGGTASSADYNAGLAFDSSMTTYWQHNQLSTAFPKWLQLDFGKSTLVNGISLTFYSQAHAPKNFELRISNNADGSNYSVLKTVANNTKSEVTYNFEAKSGRYLRIHVTEGNSNDWWNPTINEVKVYSPWMYNQK